MTRDPIPQPLTLDGNLLAVRHAGRIRQLLGLGQAEELAGLVSAASRSFEMLLAALAVRVGALEAAPAPLSFDAILTDGSAVLVDSLGNVLWTS